MCAEVHRLVGNDQLSPPCLLYALYLELLLLADQNLECVGNTHGNRISLEAPTISKHYFCM